MELPGRSTRWISLEASAKLTYMWHVFPCIPIGFQSVCSVSAAMPSNNPVVSVYIHLLKEQLESHFLHHGTWNCCWTGTREENEQQEKHVVHHNPFSVTLRERRGSLNKRQYKLPQVSYKMPNGNLHDSSHSIINLSYLLKSKKFIFQKCGIFSSYLQSLQI